MGRRLISLIMLIFSTLTVQAQEFSGLARVIPDESALIDRWTGPEVTLSLSQGIPWRAYTLTRPARLVLDFREVDWTDLDRDAFDQSKVTESFRVGAVRPGWSRMVIDLDTLMAIKTAGMQVDPELGTAKLVLRLEDVTQQDFEARSGRPNDPRWDLPEPTLPSKKQQNSMGEGPIVVVLDPGHGGIDPGAEDHGITEKDIMLSLARELRDALRRYGGFKVVMTREDDRFVSLERRVAIAHEVNAHLFISLHADILPAGHARGATVHLLDEKASDEASRQLAERHNRDDLLSGVDLTGQDDVVAGVLMDLARQETEPRSEQLSKALVLSLKRAGVPVNNRPVRRAAFSVLKAADIPSVLIETGFLSDRRDAENLKNPAWRAGVAEALRDGIKAWAIADISQSQLRRK